MKAKRPFTPAEGLEVGKKLIKEFQSHDHNYLPIIVKNVESHTASTRWKTGTKTVTVTYRTVCTKCGKPGPTVQ